MRKSIIPFLFALLSIPAYAQRVAIQVDKMNILQVGVRNPLTIAASDAQSKDLVVTTDNGVIIKGGAPGNFYMVPDHIGVASVIVSKKIKNGLKKLDAVRYRVKPATPVMRLDEHGMLPALTLYRSEGIYQLIEKRCTEDIVDTCSYTIWRNGQQIFSQRVSDVYGRSYNEPVLKFFKTLQDGDKLSIQVTTQPVGNSYPHLRTLDFIISDTEAMRKELSRVFVIDPVTGVETEVK